MTRKDKVSKTITVKKSFLIRMKMMSFTIGKKEKQEILKGIEKGNGNKKKKSKEIGSFKREKKRYGPRKNQFQRKLRLKLAIMHLLSQAIAVELPREIEATKNLGQSTLKTRTQSLMLNNRENHF